MSKTTSKRRRGPRRSTRGAHGAPIFIAVADQEVCANGREVWPNSWTWSDQDAYLDELEALAEAFAEQGRQPFYCFIDPGEYVEWCRATGLEVDSSHSRAMFASWTGRRGDAIPYDPEQPLWPLGIVSMILRSDAVARSRDAFKQHPAEVEFFDRYTDELVARTGSWRNIVTASRYQEHDEPGLWEHFGAAIASEVSVTFCDGYLSVQDMVRHNGERLEFPHYGRYNPVESVLSLAAHGHGLFGIEHHSDAGVSFKAWAVSATAIEPVAVEVLEKRLNVPPHISLITGWSEPVA